MYGMIGVWEWNTGWYQCMGMEQQVVSVHTSSSIYPTPSPFLLPPQIANIGPASYNYDETLNTLRYANRAKNIQNRAHINEDPKDAMLREFQKEIEELKKQLADASGSEGESSGEEEVGEGEGKKRGRKRKHRKRPLGEICVFFCVLSSVL